MKYLLRPISLAVVVCVLSWSAAVTSADEMSSLSKARSSIRVADIKKHTNVLASNTFEGREAGSRGGRASGIYLVGELKKLGVEPAGDRKGYYQEFGAGYRNILAKLPGSDASLQNEYILIGAHYDHVGYGTRNNSRGPTGFIHNGADDNASGTAAVLELVEAFTQLEPRPKRSILFVLWDAEEKGLLGSEHWVSRPTIPLRQIRFCLNIDMIGRLRKDAVDVWGQRTAPGLRRIVCETNSDSGLSVTFKFKVARDSDHYPFYERGIPFLFAHTGKHDDYHRPSDDVDKLNIDGIRKVTHLYFNLLHAVADSEDLPRYRSVVRRETPYVEREPESSPIRLGVTWDPDLEKKQIIKLVSVVRGSAAEKGELKPGDRILKFGNLDTKDFPDFRTLVLTSKKEVPVVIERDGEEKPMTLNLTLGGDRVRLGIAWRTDTAEPKSVILTNVVPGSPADVAGLKSSDRIHRIDGKGFASSDDFFDLATTLKSPVPVIFERQGRIRKGVITVPGESRVARPRPTGRAWSNGRITGTALELNQFA
jgi:hypothetical protein